jgi:glycerophosphoryl diester phosphodiesterase
MRWSLRVPAIAVLFLILNGLPWSGRADEARWGKRPAQYYAPLATELRLGSADVLGIAHNAGNTPASAQLALAHGSDVIEIDVRAIGGKLHAAHTPPPGWLPSQAYNGLTLGQAWTQVTGARYVQLDLKDTSTETTRLVASFLERHKGERRVLVSTKSYRALEIIHERSQDVGLLLSIGNTYEMQALLDAPERAEILTGVSVRATLLDEETMAWFKDRGLLVVAWTVNDVDHLNDLVALGIDAVSTDNLAILDAMHWAEQRRDALNLGRLFP